MIADTRRFLVLEVYWPSQRFARVEPAPAAAPGSEAAVLTDAIAAFATLFGDEAAVTLAAMHVLAPRLASDPAARARFLALLRRLVPEPRERDQDHAEEFLRLPADEFWNRIGGGPALATVGVVDRVRDALDIATFYVMKERAGRIGREALSPRLLALRAAAPSLVLHLAGHSFGARLVTAATMGADGAPALDVGTLTLLQAAFSHYAFSENETDSQPPQPGFFHAIRARGQVRGPTLITHSRNDTAVGLAYPIAARLGGGEPSVIGGPTSRYGALGRNGAQRTARTHDEPLGSAGAVHAFAPGDVHNLNGDGTPGEPGVIAGHLDVVKPEIAHAWVAAIARS